MHAARGAGEAAVGNQRDLLAHALAVDDRGGQASHAYPVRLWALRCE